MVGRFLNHLWHTQIFLMLWLCVVTTLIFSFTGLVLLTPCSSFLLLLIVVVVIVAIVTVVIQVLMELVVKVVIVVQYYY